MRYRPSESLGSAKYLRINPAYTNKRGYEDTWQIITKEGVWKQITSRYIRQLWPSYLYIYHEIRKFSWELHIVFSVVNIYYCIWCLFLSTRENYCYMKKYKYNNIFIFVLKIIMWVYFHSVKPLRNYDMNVWLSRQSAWSVSKRRGFESR